MTTNRHMTRSRQTRDDEFYTQYSDVLAELKEYLKRDQELLKDKVIYCPCDSPDSNFYKYFSNNFAELGLRTLICSWYKPGAHGGLLIMDATGTALSELEGEGSLLDSELDRFYQQADLVVTNPPYSLIGPVLSHILPCSKDYLLLVPITCTTRAVVAERLVSQSARLGYTSPTYYTRPGGSIVPNRGAYWLTSLQVEREPLKLIKPAEQKPEDYQNLDGSGVLVSKTMTLPEDYTDPIAVPITFLYHHDPKQFRILRAMTEPLAINNKRIFKKFLIQREV